MRQLHFPIQLNFKIGTISNDFVAYDAQDQMIAYVRQKLLKWKEEIQVYADESKSQLTYTIKADRWLDFSAAYSFTDGYGDYLGKIVRQGWRSIWKASYDLLDHEDKTIYTIEEENPWIKAWDSLIGEVPIIGALTGYLFNPSYLITDVNGDVVATLRKEPSFWGRKFTIYNTADISADHGEIIMLGLMMMVLLERRRG